jgi:1-deoxy-D-xylulose-5-phosphate reductoisomerase
VLNAANEVAVERFLKGELSFLSIVEIVSRVLEKHAAHAIPIASLEDALHWDTWARNEARGIDVAIPR